MAKPIIPRLVRGDLFFQVSEVLFPTFAAAVSAWLAVQAEISNSRELSGGGL